MVRKFWDGLPVSTRWFASGAAFCVAGALLASGPNARDVAAIGVWGAIGFVVLIIAFRDKPSQGRS